MFSSARGAISHPARGFLARPFKQRKGQVLVDHQVRGQPHVKRRFQRLCFHAPARHEHPHGARAQLVKRDANRPAIDRRQGDVTVAREKS